MRNLRALGFDVEVDKELRTILIKQFESCECCGGFINLCDGDICSALGMCVCLHTFVQEKEYDN